MECAKKMESGRPRKNWGSRERAKGPGGGVEKRGGADGEDERGERMVYHSPMVGQEK